MKKRCILGITFVGMFLLGTPILIQCKDAFAWSIFGNNQHKGNNNSAGVIFKEGQFISSEGKIIQHDDPSLPPPEFLFVWWKSGYTLQPQDINRYVGQKRQLQTSFQRAAYEQVGAPGTLTRIRWYRTTDEGKHWDIYKNQSENFDVSNEKVGVEYFQQRVFWTYDLLAQDPKKIRNERVIYSRVAKVTTLPSPHPATDVSLSVDREYLYDNIPKDTQATVKAKLTPNDSTSNIEWSIDKKGNEDGIAKIDNNGVVTVSHQPNNRDGERTRIITVRAHVYNDRSFNDTDSSNFIEFDKTIDLKIGGGLENKSAEDNDPVTFHIQGDITDGADKIIWHAVKTNGEKLPDIVINKTAGSMSKDVDYHLDKVTTDMNGMKVWAEIQKMAPEDHKGEIDLVTTNKAILTVFFDKVSKLKIKLHAVNNSYSNGNKGDLLLDKVTAGDQITIHGSVKQADGESPISNPVFFLRIPKAIQISEYISDNINKNSKIIDKNNNVFQKFESSNYYELPIGKDDWDFQTSNSHEFTLKFVVHQNQIGNFSQTSNFQGNDNMNNKLSVLIDPLKINFVEDIFLMSPHSINFGKFNKYSAGDEYVAKIGDYKNDSFVEDQKSEILTIDDRRRSKNHMAIYLSELHDFEDEITHHKLDSELRLYNNEFQLTRMPYTIIGKKRVLVSESASGYTMDSLYWNGGLRLFVYPGSYSTATYKTFLQWERVDSV